MAQGLIPFPLVRVRRNPPLVSLISVPPLRRQRGVTEMPYLHPSLGTPHVERHHSCRAPNRLRGRGEALVDLAWEADDGQWADWLRVPLRVAARKGDLDMVDALVGAGAACSGMNREDTTSLLHEAVASGRCGWCGFDSSCVSLRVSISRDARVLAVKRILRSDACASSPHVKRAVDAVEACRIYQ